MRELWQVFLNAVMFFTRIPVNAQYTPERLNRASIFFPVVGWLVGAFVAAVYWACSLLLPPLLAVLLSTAAGIYLTGAFHEDGFADMCDGFGGGYTPERILEIMKDSRIGTYGSVGLMLMLATKIAALTEVSQQGWPTMGIVLIAGHSLSRAISGSVIFLSNYVQADTLSKAKPLATRMSLKGFLVMALFGLFPLALLPLKAGFALLAALATLPIMLRIFHRNIGGYTGDCLGALQQLAEVFFYMALIPALQNA